MSPGVTVAGATRTDLLLLALHVALEEAPEVVRGPASLEELLQRLADAGVGVPYFAGPRARRALIEGLANLEQNGLVERCAGLSLTSRGRQRIRHLTADLPTRQTEDQIREVARSVTA